MIVEEINKIYRVFLLQYIKRGIKNESRKNEKSC